MKPLTRHHYEQKIKNLEQEKRELEYKLFIYKGLAHRIYRGMIDVMSTTGGGTLSHAWILKQFTETLR